MEYIIRLAMDDDIPPALDLAWRMFVKYDSLAYGVEHEHFGFTVEDEEKNADTPWKTPMSYIL